MLKKISYKKASLSDALRISVLLKTVYIQTYAVDGISFEFANFIQQRFALEHIKKLIEEGSNQLIVAHYKGNPVGVAEIIFETTCSIRNIPVAKLDKLYVLERFYGKGIGYQLLIEVEKEVAARGIKDLCLDVYLRNDRAINFYQRQGYVSIGHSYFTMESNTYKNLVMNKSLD